MAVSLDVVIFNYTNLFEIRNCYNGTDNHNNTCSQGDGLIIDPAYVHRNVLYVFR